MNKKIKQIEKILGTTIDGVWGADDKKALSMLTTAKKGGPPPPEAAPAPSVTPAAAPAEMQTYQ